MRYRLADGTEGEASSEALSLKVATLLPKDPQEQKLADVRGPAPVSIGRAFWVALGVALALVAALVAWIVHRRRSKGAPPAAAVPDLAPDAEALRALDALAAAGFLARGEYRSFYIRLAEVAKRYLERRTGAPVLEMTTAETLAFLRGHPHGGDLLPVMRDVAEAADRIKFAKGQGLSQEAERHLAAVRALVPGPGGAAAAGAGRARGRGEGGLMDWAGFRFQDPAWLWAALAAPLVLLAAWRRERDVLARAVAFPGASRLRRVRPGWRVRLRHLPLALAALGLVAGALALARPQHGTLREDVTTRGVDIVVSLDVSGTMAAGDFQPRNRLEVAKEVVAEFVKRRTSDRVGLVVFAGRSLTKSPPTTDTAVLLRQLEDVRLEMLPDGTAIGSGLATALTRLRRSEAKSKVIVLVTDGDNNAGEIDPATAADMAKAMEVRVYTILVGRGGRVPMPVRARDPFTGAVETETVMADVKVNPELLKQIAERTGAEFFRAEDPVALRQVFERIDKLEKSEIQVAAYRRYRELFPALALLRGASRRGRARLGLGPARGAGVRSRP